MTGGGAASANDPYDGHARYRAQAENEASYVKVRNWAEFAISTIAGWTAAYWVYLATWPTKRGVGDKFMSGLGVGAVGLFVCLVTVSAIGDASTSRRSWWRITGATMAAFLLGGIAPAVLRGNASESAKRTDREVRAEFDLRSTAVRRKWYDDLHAAGAHGPAGEQPPMLAVEDSGRRVVVHNVGDVELHSVCLRRGGYFMRANRQECVRLRRNESATFELDSRDPEVETKPLVFRVGDAFDPEPSWWSDEVLRDYYGREFELERSDVR